ncbi:MAG: hypothetical protein MI921_28510 [Cytophagales bacterium]|nr:hypothetical protein [Cytophagales bacterium]
MSSPKNEIPEFNSRPACGGHRRSFSSGGFRGIALLFDPVRRFYLPEDLLLEDDKLPHTAARRWRRADM